MLASDSICLDKFKDIFHVFIAVPSPFAGLTTFKEKAPDSLIEYWQIRDSRKISKFFLISICII